MNLKELLIKIGFDVDKSKLDGVEKQLDGIKTMLEAFAAVEVVKGIVEMTEKFGEMAEKVHLAAISAGITTEAYQRLAFAAEQNGVSQDELGASMARLTRHIYDARMGSSEAQQTFANAGFTSAQIQGFKNSSDVLHALSDRFKGMKDPIKEIGILTPLLGKGSRNMVEFMEQGAAGMQKLENAAIVLTEGQIKALVDAKHAAQAAGNMFTVLAGTVAAELAPSVEYLSNQFVEFYKANKDIINLEIRKWFYDITFVMGFVFAMVKDLTQGFLSFAKSHETLTRHAGELILVIGGISSALFLGAKAYQVTMSVLGPTITLVKALYGAVGIAKNLFFGFFEVLGWVTKQQWLMNAAAAAFEAPLWLIISAVGLAVVAIHDLWAVAHGKPGWINSLIEAAGYGKAVEKVFFSIFDIVGKLGSLPGWAIGKVSGLFGSNTAQNVAGVQDLVSAGPRPAPGTVNNASTASHSTEINAPVTIHVPAGSNPKEVHAAVQDGIQAHLDRQHREAQRALQPVQVF